MCGAFHEMHTCCAGLSSGSLGLGLYVVNLKFERIEAGVELGVGIDQLLDLLFVGESLRLGRRKAAGHCSNCCTDYTLCSSSPASYHSEGGMGLGGCSMPSLLHADYGFSDQSLVVEPSGESKTRMASFGVYASPCARPCCVHATLKAC